MDHTHTVSAILLLLSAHSVSGTCNFSTTEKNQEVCTGLFECSGEVDILSTIVRHWDCLNRQRICHYSYPCEDVPRQFLLKIKVTNPYHVFEYYYYNNIADYAEKVVMLALINCDMTAIPLEIFNWAKLSVLDVSHNKIGSVDLNLNLKLDKLLFFNASYNLISQLQTAAYHDYGFGSNVTVIDLSYNAIKDLPDYYFNKFTNLHHLNMSHNLINNFNLLTFEGLSQLETLYLSNNYLHTIDTTLVRFTNLKELTLDHNNLSSIEENNFKQLSKLIKLNLSFNKIISIHDFSFQNMVSLRIFQANNNKVKVISKSMFINNNALQEVDFANNLIHTIEPFSFKGTNITLCSFRNNALTALNDKSIFEGINVKVLDLSGNNINLLGENVFIDLKSELRTLNLSTNSISHIHENSFKALNLLSELDLSNNAIVEIDLFSFRNLEAVEVLDLSNNDLPNVIVPNMFQGLSKIYKLHITNSKISSLRNAAFYTMTDLIYLNASCGAIKILEYNVFNGTENIWSLDLSHNRLETFTVNNTYLKYVQEIYLNDNQIERITNQTFYGLNHLRELKLENNNILQISVDAFRNLYKISLLYLSSNVNMMFDTSVFSNISTLIDIRLHNVWKPFNFKNVKHVSILNLDLSSSNISDISSVMVYKLIKLETLLLNSNKIRFIDRKSFQNLSSLISLDLSNNLISTIKPGSFTGTPAISVLDLHNNNLAFLSFGVFNALANLQVLNLSSNVLHNFQSTIFHDNHKLLVISLDDNMIDNLDFDEIKSLAIPKMTIGGNLVPCDFLALLKKKNKYDINITSENLNFHVENVDGITCKGAKIETSSDDPVSQNKAGSSKIKDVTERINLGRPNFQIISNQIDTLKSALYFEASCLFIIVCMLFGALFFVYIKLRSNLVKSFSLRSERHLTASVIEMEL